jgi:hypothetical protein
MSESLDHAENAAMQASPPLVSAPGWRRAVPFVVAIGLIAFTLSRVDLRAFVRHVAAVNTPAFLLFNVAFMLALLTADAFATVVVYRRIGAPVRFGEFWVFRGASYLPSILNHHLGQAILTYYVSRRYRVSLARMAGGTLLAYASWGGCLLGAGCIAMVVAGMPLQWPGLALAAGAIYLAIIALRPAPLAAVKLLAPLFEAGLAGHVEALAARLPHFVVLFLGTWLPFFFFDVKIPLGQALVYMPMLMVVVTLPVAPQGLGTRDAFATFFLARFAAGATEVEQRSAAVSATASFAVAMTLVEALLGLLLLRRAMPAFDPKPPAAGSAGST